MVSNFLNANKYSSLYIYNMEFIKSTIITIILFFLRYLYLDSKLHSVFLNISKYSSYILLIVLLSIFVFYKNKNISNKQITGYVILFIIGRVVYRNVVGAKITNNSFHIYNNTIFTLGIFLFSFFVL